MNKTRKVVRKVTLGLLAIVMCFSLLVLVSVSADAYDAIGAYAIGIKDIEGLAYRENIIYQGDDVAILAILLDNILEAVVPETYSQFAPLIEDRPPYFHCGCGHLTLGSRIFAEHHTFNAQTGECLGVWQQIMDFCTRCGVTNGVVREVSNDFGCGRIHR